MRKGGGAREDGGGRDNDEMEGWEDDRGRLRKWRLGRRWMHIFGGWGLRVEVYWREGTRPRRFCCGVWRIREGKGEQSLRVGKWLRNIS